MGHYINLPREIEERIIEDRNNHWINPYAFKNEDCVRRHSNHDNKNLIMRPQFVRDCEKIMHVPYYSRYNDKTQVFSLFKNDDITRRGLHVQLVSRIARNIGSILGLNVDLIEAIAIGHDIGHTPFGHAGERKLSELYYGHAGKYFNHNIHSARVLDTIYPRNISLQTLDGIICHNGEMEQKCYKPVKEMDFEKFDERMKESYSIKDISGRLVPSTLEACVVRVSDIIAYLGKDRQDALKLGMLDEMSVFSGDAIGTGNAEIINNMSVNIVKNSYGKDYLSMDEDVYEAFSRGKKENYSIIYKSDPANDIFNNAIFPMIEQVYEKLLSDMKEHNKNSVIYTHHIDYRNSLVGFYPYEDDYENQPADDLVVDYIASMTDDYFIDLYRFLFPGAKYDVKYVPYFQ